MIGEDTIDLLTRDPAAPFDYILGCRMRKQREVSEDLLGRAARYQRVADNLEVKDVVVSGRHYVVCRNPQEAEKDRLARDAILAKLAQALAHGPKSVIGNRGFARFVKIRRGSVTINPKAVEDDARLDGKFVLTTNTLLPTDQVALAYKSLWRVERTFREESPRSRSGRSSTTSTRTRSATSSAVSSRCGSRSISRSGSTSTWSRRPGPT